MNTKKGIAIGLAVVMISMIAAYAVPMVGADEPRVYTATVTTTTIDITILGANTAFNDIARGESGTIANSLHIRNKGTQTAKMSAKFTSKNSSDIYGMVSTNDVIPGTNFKLKDVPLNAGVSDGVLICSDIDTGVYSWISATLAAPSDVFAELYTGTIELTFGEA